MDAQDARSAIRDLQAALARKSRTDVNVTAGRLVTEEARLGRQWKAIATVLQHNGEYALARRAVELWAAQAPDDAHAGFERATVLAQTGALDQASAILKSLPADIPDRAANAYMRGTVATNLGRLDEARQHLRDAIAANPASGQAWLALAMTGRIGAEDENKLLSAQQRMSSALPAERAAYLYAIAKLFEQQGDHARAFAAVDEGAALVRDAHRYNLAADQTVADAAIAGWALDLLAVPDQQKRSRAIFVTGLPRSGTTLVEQILASHTAVDGGEELGLFRLLERDIGGKRKDDFDYYLARGGSAAELRSLYAHLLGQRFEGSGLVVDKTLNASRYMGMIACLFPEAPIIWMRRDPLDCAWSAYRTWFLRGVDWSWSLADIAAHFSIEDALYDHWTSLLGDRILTVDYAELVSDPEPQIARIVTHCGLALEPQQLTPHKTQRTVVTASVTQVREPINAKGIGSAEPYREYLKPFIDAYYGG